MPEIKNTFLKGKMNKDLDARLIPNGEYVDAQNIHITKSEGSDVGVVQNIKGNTKLGNVSASGTIIGYIEETESQTDGSNRIFYFFAGDNPADHAIYYYNTLSAGSPIKILGGSFLNFNKNYLITGINIIDSLLFWTDNLNQPRKINIDKAIETPVTYYNNEDKISVAKYYPYNAPQVFNGNVTGLQKSTTTQSVTTTSGSADITYTGTVNNDIYTGQTVAGAGIPAGAVVNSISSNGLTITLSNNATASATITATFSSDKSRLEEEFVKFAYRFKFIDNEYSLISPFTQTCFIPKTYNNSSGLTEDQIKNAYKTTEVQSMVNDVSNIFLKIKLPSANILSDYHINKIEILYKEADNPGLKSVALLDLTDSSPQDYIYEYKNTLPFKTLPESQVIRVYDNVPLKAKAQEISGNRLIYGNYEQNFDLTNIDFEASYGVRSDVLANDQKWLTQYPYQTVKSRRTYQVGLVLADKYGRQSPVILPSDQTKSTVKVPAMTGSAAAWNGDCLKIEFNQEIPIKWYSWKVVVKQTEQEYYNVYSPAVKDGFPSASSIIPDGIASTVYGTEDKRSWLILHGDNINKVPKDSDLNVQEEGTSGSNVKLYPKVLNSHAAANVYSSGGGLVDVISIGTAKEQGLTPVDSSTYLSTGVVLGAVYESAKNHLAAELPHGYGWQTLGTTTQYLGVWETKPVDSALDIYYETSLTGLVSELNSQITSAGGGPDSIHLTNSTFSEGHTGNTIIGGLSARDSNNNTLSGIAFTLISVKDANDNVIYDKFDISGANLRAIAESFYHGASGESFTITIQASDGSNNPISRDLTVTTTNASPIMGSGLAASTTSTHYSLGDPSAPGGSTAVGIIDFATGTKNGSSDSSRDTLGLTYSITSVHLKATSSGALSPPTDVTSSNLFTLAGSELQNANFFAKSTIGNIYTVVGTVTDAGGLTDTHSVDITISAHVLANYLYGNFNQLCSPLTATFYLTKTSSSSNNNINEGDFIWTNTAATSAFGGYLVTATSGGEFGDGKYANVAGGGDPGEVMLVDQSRDCGN